MSKQICLTVTMWNENEPINKMSEIEFKIEPDNKLLEMNQIINWDYVIEKDCVKISMFLLYKKIDGELFCPDGYIVNYETKKITLPNKIDNLDVSMYDINLNLKLKWRKNKK